MTTADPAIQPRTRRTDRWLAVVVVSFGTFLLVTAEQLPVGLLTRVESALSVSAGTAGLMVTVTSVVAGLAAPVVPVLVGRMDRRWLLVGLMGLMTLANVVSGLAPNFGVLIASRALVGVAIGGFWAVAGGLAVRLVSADRVPRATAIIFGGVGAANVFGVPIGTVLGDLTGWRVAFATLSGLALVVLIALLGMLPPLAASRPVGPRDLVDQFRNRAVRIGILATLLIVTGHFVAYTFVRPILQQLSGVSDDLVGPLLFGFGLAGMAGNFLAGATLARQLRRTVLVIVGALAAVLLLFPAVGSSAAGGIALLIAWGLAYGGVSVSLQTWMIRAAPQAVEAASSLWVSVFNLAIGLGALAGGVIVDALTLEVVLWLAGASFLVTGLLVWRVRAVGSLR
ncbi:MFS transporter [Saccharomonospora cyanea]|uniref:Arabinose efflux permease family protein n=1 Tax=Saccharomonospora cyanea NA-134 TaxID=882082 RepID=H5XMD9_9PSEU|nr:MFS transporter [Saccharomonospora cyanea]EHR59888.1 arabinose efflux permease family protein [Saccharomonospora cyanea NA-134]